MAADGGDLRRHTDCQSVCTYPWPSPDGRFLAYRRVIDTPGLSWNLDPGTRNSEVFVQPLAGGEPVNVSNDSAYDGWPTWSRDSRWVVFVSNRDKIANAGQVFAVSRTGKDLRRLTSGTLSRIQPSFNRAGDRIFVNEGIATDDFEVTHIASFPFDLLPESSPSQ